MNSYARHNLLLTNGIIWTFLFTLLFFTPVFAEKGDPTRGSVDSVGGEGNRPSIYPAISSGGKYVAFHSLATNLDPLPLMPVPDIKANGSDGPITITQGDLLTVTVALDPGSQAGEDADWWGILSSPFGWFYYSLPSGWHRGQTFADQAPLDSLISHDVFNRSDLPIGLYTFYFGVDLLMNGDLDVDQVYYDTVEVNITEADTTPPTIISSNPPDGATKVNILTDIEITVSEHLDESTVNTTTITITYKENIFGSETERCAVTYDKLRKVITVHPLKPLISSKSYNVVFSSIKDLAGNIMADTSITFRAHQNPMTFSVSYMDGDVYVYYTQTFDTVGNLIRRADYDGPGSDGIWFTVDDTVRYSSVYSYDADGNNTQNYSPDGPGLDGIWFTIDDELSYYTVYTFNTNGKSTQRIIYSEFGLDGIWFTDDDVISSYHAFTRDDNGNMTLDVFYIGKGLDDIWYTDDDVVSSYHTYIYDTDGNCTQSAFYHGGPGPDGTWFTNDDVVYSYYAYTYSPDGNRTRFISQNGPGPDGTWFTDDDDVKFYNDYIYNTDEKMTRSIEYKEFGLDGIWFTDDDVIGKFIAYTYDTDGNKTMKVRYNGPGPDGILFTDDDDVDHYEARSYDTDGKMTRYIDFTESGPDGIWLTDDDFFRSYRDYTYDTDRAKNLSVIYFEGPDGTWFTDDDEIWHYYHYIYDSNRILTMTVSYSGTGPDGIWLTDDDITSSQSEYDASF
ncbi:Ig-like domain-containing protein [Thermodesulfobacteriota bacterium]